MLSEIEERHKFHDQLLRGGVDNEGLVSLVSRLAGVVDKIEARSEAAEKERREELWDVEKRNQDFRRNVMIALIPTVLAVIGMAAGWIISHQSPQPQTAAEGPGSKSR